MMTKEKYTRDLIRMWDSVRKESKGKENCSGVSCINCPFNGELCNTGKQHPYEIIELVENWAKEHPVKTNADKFREVFGVEYEPKNACIIDADCRDCQYCDDDGMCEVNKRFWNAEYKGGVDGE